jgi:hypothetical protein
MKPALKFRGLRFARTAGEAFRDASYGAAIERPTPPLLQRLLSFFFPNT